MFGTRCSGSTHVFQADHQLLEASEQATIALTHIPLLEM